MGTIDENALSAHVLAHLDSAVIAVDAELMITLWNHAAEQLYGWPAPEVLSKPVSAVIPAVRYLDGQTRTQARTTLFATDSWHGQVVQPHREGHNLVIEAAVRLIRDAHGAPLSIIALNRPSTAVRHSKAASRANEEYWRALVEHAADILSVIDRDGVMRYVSPGLVEMLGYPSEYWLGRTADELVYPDEQAAALSFFERVMREPEHVQRLEVGLRHSDGNRHIVAVTARNLLADPAIHGVVITGHELAVGQQVEELWAREEQFRVLFEHSPDAIMLIDPHDPSGLWPIVDCNEAACRMNGYTREEMIGQPSDLLNPGPEWFDPGTSHLDRIRAAGTLQDEDIQRRKDGTLIVIEYSTTLVTLGGRELILGIDRDVTARKQAELTLVQAKDEAERANRAKNEFLSRMSHELRTPLNAILGFGQYLETELGDEAHREYAGYIVKAGEHLLGLVNDVLDIARIENERLALQLVPVAVGTALSAALMLVRARADEQAIRLNAVQATNYPGRVLGDPQRLQQVLVNLLSNAIKYNKAGGHVDIHIFEVAGRMRLMIKDTGLGIASEQMGRLFTPFDRLGVEQSGIEGVGLGLALSRQLVEQMNGKIDVDSEVGKGSVFWVDLPLMST